MNSRATFLASALALALPCAACATVAQDPLPGFGPLGLQDDGAAAVPTETPQRGLEWFRSGWYVGASMGAARADADASDVDRALADRGYDTTTSLDKTDLGWKAFIGYRFEKPWAVELAVADLGVVKSTIDTDASDMDAFLEDVADVHPHSGAGISLVGTYYPIERDHFDLGLKAGLWVWEADKDVDAALGESFDLEEDGNVDPVLGIVGLIDLSRSFSARLEWERYFMDINDVDYFSVGLQFMLSR